MTNLFERTSSQWVRYLSLIHISGVQTVPLLTDAKAGVLAITAWTMTAEPTGLWHRPAAPAGDAIPLGERTSPTSGRDTTAQKGPPQSRRLCGERRSKGASAVFAVWQKRRKADFATTRW